ncbi:hypothetical protein P154DRAFT_529864 [Amniculicola lignicola CBS 123094]|uniref:Uncharacterized protein n=1 Tax=Amniculicola lignicola CBS 123094 TaxID=1392246 RepID=A0A6A5WWI8_9PLEO|nr:hypothetical protein P154DRAFT_529864 [Amniculicola lignicola CBS 123094]
MGRRMHAEWQGFCGGSGHGVLEIPDFHGGGRRGNSGNARSGHGNSNGGGGYSVYGQKLQDSLRKCRNDVPFEIFDEVAFDRGGSTFTLCNWMGMQSVCHASISSWSSRTSNLNRSMIAHRAIQRGLARCTTETVFGSSTPMLFCHNHLFTDCRYINQTCAPLSLSFYSQHSIPSQSARHISATKPTFPNSNSIVLQAKRNALKQKCGLAEQLEGVEEASEVEGVDVEEEMGEELVGKEEE